MLATLASCHNDKCGRPGTCVNLQTAQVTIPLPNCDLPSRPAAWPAGDRAGWAALSYRWPVGRFLAHMGGQVGRIVAPVPGGGGWWTCHAIHRTPAGPARRAGRTIDPGVFKRRSRIYVRMPSRMWPNSGVGLLGCAGGALSGFGCILGVMCVSFLVLCVAWLAVDVRR